MAQKIEEIMTKKIHSVGEQASLRQVAKTMRDERVGDVLVTDDQGKLCGIVTDRDIVVRVVAEGKDLDSTRTRDICSAQVATLRPDSSVEEAIELMRTRAIRRVPVVANGKPVGIISIGDLARQRDPNSALADISAAAPNN